MLEALVTQPSAFDIQTAPEKLTSCNSPDTDQIEKGLIQAGGTALCSEVHKVINAIWNKEESPDQWKEPIIGSTDTKGNKIHCSNYQGTSLSSVTYKMLCSIPFSI